MWLTKGDRIFSRPEESILYQTYCNIVKRFPCCLIYKRGVGRLLRHSQCACPRARAERRRGKRSAHVTLTSGLLPASCSPSPPEPVFNEEASFRAPLDQ